MAEQIGNEAKTLGVSQVFAPLADLARELRYGRVEETYGEDGYLAGEMAMSYVKAVQGTNVSAMVKVGSEQLRLGSSISVPLNSNSILRLPSRIPRQPLSLPVLPSSRCLISSFLCQYIQKYHAYALA